MNASSVLRMIAAAGLFPAAALLADELPPITIAVGALSAQPTVDGQLDDWSEATWYDVPIKPAVDGDTKNRTGEITVRLASTVVGDRIYIAMRWPDQKADTSYKDWVWSGSKYRRGKNVDDMVALRFDMAGDYDSCMLSEQEYEVDVWRWSAGRSNPAGYATDMWQLITTRFLDQAAEYEGPSGKMVYIRKGKDEGTAIYANTRPNRKVKTADSLPGIQQNSAPDGSVADVRAKGVWADGFWNLEFSRALDTGNSDDAALNQGSAVTKIGAIAVFNRAASEHKSVSGDLLFDFSALR